MKLLRQRSTLASVLLLVLLAACGAEGPADSPDALEQPAPPEPEGMVLEADDFVGIEEDRIGFNLHWVDGPVSRQPPRLAPPVTTLQEVTTVAGATFDRVIFRFADGAFPGYALEWTEEDPRDCATGAPVELAGERRLRLGLSAVSAGAESLAAQQPEHANLQGMVSTCAREGLVEWHLGVLAPAKVRVLELRDPVRLVVDVRHGSEHRP